MIKKFLNHPLIGIKIICKNQWKVVSLSLIMFIYCTINVTNWIRIVEDYADSSDCIMNKQAAINHINKKDNKCFQCAVIVALNHEKIGKNSKRMTKIKPLINKFNWEGINFP